MTLVIGYELIETPGLRPYVVGSRSNGIGHEFVLP